MGSETRQLYEALFRRVRSLRASAVVPFRCDAPARRRYMELEIIPASEGGLRLDSRSIREEKREAVGLLDPTADRSDEFLVLCSWCRRARLEDGRPRRQ